MTGYGKKTRWKAIDAYDTTGRSVWDTLSANSRAHTIWFTYWGDLLDSTKTGQGKDTLASYSIRSERDSNFYLTVGLTGLFGYTWSNSYSISQDLSYYGLKCGSTDTLFLSTNYEVYDPPPDYTPHTIKTPIYKIVKVATEK